MQDTELPEVTELRRLVLEPDDIVVVMCPRAIPLEQAQRLKEILGEKLRIPTDRFIVLGDGIRIGVVTP